MHTFQIELWGSGSMLLLRSEKTDSVEFAVAGATTLWLRQGNSWTVKIVRDDGKVFHSYEWELDKMDPDGRRSNALL
jgi:hypothetical protein